MDSKSAAEKLGVSVRSLQRLVKKYPQIAVTHARGKSGKIEASYKAEDIAWLKKEINKPVEREPAPAQSEGAALTALAPGDGARQLQAIPPRNQLTALALLVREVIGDSEPLSESAPLMLSIPQAARLSGLSVSMLREAVKDGRLIAHRGIGHGLGKIKRSDLRDFISKL
jgi:excisionase family DNA binding protein